MHAALPILLDKQVETNVLIEAMAAGIAQENVRATAHLLVADISLLMSNEELQAEALSKLSDYRRGKVEACGNPRSRAQSVGVGILLNRLLADYDLRECEMNYLEGKHGKPFFENHQELVFNLSHSGSLVAAVIFKNVSEKTNLQLGLDLQLISRYRPEIVRRMFSAHDKALLATCTTEAERERLFAQCWCRAEAYGKATAIGLQWPFPSPPAEAEFHDFEINENYCGSLCLLNKEVQ